jgi:protein deglycase
MPAIAAGIGGLIMKKACILLAEGFEEIEAVTPIDYLRRAGVEVTILGVGGLHVRGSHGIVVSADAALDEKSAGQVYDAVIIPGGMPGAKHLAGSKDAVDLIRRHYADGKVVAAICAAPAVVLHGACGLLQGKRFTGYPGTETQVKGGFPQAERVVIDGNLITSRGAGTAGEFAMALIDALARRAEADRVAEAVLLRA